MRKVYVVVGSVAYENDDTLGIYTSKDAAIKAATKIAKRPVDYYADYVNYDTVYVYATSLNVAFKDLGAPVWKNDGMKRSMKRKAKVEETESRKYAKAAWRDTRKSDYDGRLG